MGLKKLSRPYNNGELLRHHTNLIFYHVENYSRIYANELRCLPRGFIILDSASSAVFLVLLKSI